MALWMLSLPPVCRLQRPSPSSACSSVHGLAAGWRVGGGPSLAARLRFRPSRADRMSRPLVIRDMAAGQGGRRAAASCDQRRLRGGGCAAAAAVLRRRALRASAAAHGLRRASGSASWQGRGQGGRQTRSKALYGPLRELQAV